MQIIYHTDKYRFILADYTNIYYWDSTLDKPNIKKILLDSNYIFKKIYQNIICSNGMLISHENNRSYEWYSNEVESYLTKKNMMLPPYTYNFICSVTAVACGVNHSIVVLENGHVYSRGSNIYGEMGIDSKIEFEPVRVVFSNTSIRFVNAMCCDNSTFVVSRDGEIWAFGRNHRGQLGISSTTNTNIPTKILFPNGVAIKSLVCGTNHVFAISTVNKLYGWGDNTNKRFCCNIDFYNVPHHIATDIKINTLSCGLYHNIAFSITNEIYTWGKNNHGQLGLSHNVDVLSPVINDYLSLISASNINCVHNSTYIETMNQLGIATHNIDINVPTRVDWIGISIISYKNKKN